MFKIIFFLLLVSCSINRIKGPNYNQGVSRNQNLKNRAAIVKKEDKRMKNAMVRVRKKASPSYRKNFRNRNKVKRKMIR